MTNQLDVAASVQALTEHEGILAWVAEVAELTAPDRIVFCDGSRAEVIWPRSGGQIKVVALSGTGTGAGLYVAVDIDLPTRRAYQRSQPVRLMNISAICRPPVHTLATARVVMKAARLSGSSSFTAKA